MRNVNDMFVTGIFTFLYPMLECMEEKKRQIMKYLKEQKIEKIYK